MSSENEGPQPGSTHTQKVTAEIADERIRQAELGWDADHDDRHNVDHLVRLAKARINKDDPLAVDEGHYSRKRLVQAAALLTAAIERFDRI